MWCVINLSSATVAGLLPLLLGVAAVLLGALSAAWAGPPPAANGWEPQARRPAGWAARLAKAAKRSARHWTRRLAEVQAAERRAARLNAHARKVRDVPAFAPHGGAPSPRPASLARTSGLWAVGQDFLEFLVPEGHWVEV